MAKEWDEYISRMAGGKLEKSWNMHVYQAKGAQGAYEQMKKSSKKKKKENIFIDPQSCIVHV